MKDKKNLIIYSAIVIYFLVTVLLYTNVIPSDEDGFITTVLYTISPFIAVIAGVYAWRNYGGKSIQGRSTFLITIGIAFWAIGEVIWLVYSYFLEIDPYPSIADVFFIIAYPFIFWGIISALKLGQIQWTQKKILFTSFITFMFAAITFYYGIYNAFDAEASFMENIVGMSYGVGDVILLVGIALLINMSLDFSGGFLAKSWLIFASGIVFTWVADILFALFYEAYEEGIFFATQIDLLWIIGYLLLAIGFIEQVSALRKIEELI